MTQATSVWEYIATHHDKNITHAAKALYVNRSTLHRVMDTAYVINGTLYYDQDEATGVKGIGKGLRKASLWVVERVARKRMGRRD